MDTQTGMATSNGISSFGITVTCSANDRPDLYETVYLTAQPREKSDVSLTQELHNTHRMINLQTEAKLL